MYMYAYVYACIYIKNTSVFCCPLSLSLLRLRYLFRSVKDFLQGHPPIHVRPAILLYGGSLEFVLLFLFLPLEIVLWRKVGATFCFRFGHAIAAPKTKREKN